MSSVDNVDCQHSQCDSDQTTLGDLKNIDKKNKSESCSTSFITPYVPSQNNEAIASGKLTSDSVKRLNSKQVASKVMPLNSSVFSQKKGKKKTGRGGSKDLSETEKDRRAELETKIRHRVACEEKAFRIVEKLVEETVTEDIFIDVGRLISPSHYDDITEERSISGICGYPICGKKLGKVLQQKYKISVKERKVYDITERKKFCSNVCYKASMWYHKQVPDTAVWAREKEVPPQICLLNPKENRGSAGEVVVQDIVSAMNHELEELEETNQTGNHGNLGSPRKSPTSSLEERISNLRFDNQDSEPLHHVDKCTEKETSGERQYKDERVEHNVGEDGDCGVTSKEAPARDITHTKGETLMMLLDQRDRLLAQKTQTVQATCQKRSQKSSAQVCESQQFADKSVPIGHKQMATVVTETGFDGTFESESSPSINATEFSGRISPSHVSMTVVNKRPTTAQVLENARRFEAQQDVLLCNNEKQSLKDKEPKSGNSNVTIEMLKRTLLDWQTDKVNQFLCKNGDGVTSSSRQTFCGKYAALEQKVDKIVTLEGLDDVVGCTDDDFSGDGTPKGKMPDTVTLQQDAQKFVGQVKEFYKPVVLDSDDDEDSAVEEKQTKASNKSQKEEDKEAGFVPRVPPVDSMSQLTLRRRIVMDRLDKVLPKLLGPLKLSVMEISTELRSLVYTFNLTRHNVILKPGEWTLMGYVVLNLLAVRVAPLSQALERKASKTFFATMLGGVGLSQEDIQQLINLVLNTDEVD